MSQIILFISNLVFGNDIAVDPLRLYVRLESDTRNAPVGGHTCLTAGEQREPADLMQASKMYRSP